MIRHCTLQLCNSACLTQQSHEHALLVKACTVTFCTLAAVANSMQYISHCIQHSILPMLILFCMWSTRPVGVFDVAICTFSCRLLPIVHTSHAVGTTHRHAGDWVELMQGTCIHFACVLLLFYSYVCYIIMIVLCSTDKYCPTCIIYVQYTVYLQYWFCLAASLRSLHSCALTLACITNTPKYVGVHKPA